MALPLEGHGGNTERPRHQKRHETKEQHSGAHWHQSDLSTCRPQPRSPTRTRTVETTRERWHLLDIVSIRSPNIGIIAWRSTIEAVETRLRRPTSPPGVGAGSARRCPG